MGSQGTVCGPGAGDQVDLEGYLQRIGYQGSREASLETLRGLVLHHVTSIPFENLNPLAGWPVRLDLPSLQEKLIRQGRGGYCFEQNSLLAHALRALGFQVGCLASRVLWNLPEGARPPRSHMLLRVDLEGGSYLADVGFGVMAPTSPLLLEPDLEQATPHEPFRLKRQEDGYVLQSQVTGDWKPLYRFTLEEQFPADYEVSNWYTSTHPESLFVRNLLAARADTGGRHTLINSQLTTYSLDGQRDQRVVGSVGELKEALQEVFRLSLPEAPELDQALQRVLVAG